MLKNTVNKDKDVKRLLTKYWNLSERGTVKTSPRLDTQRKGQEQFEVIKSLAKLVKTIENTVYGFEHKHIE